MTMATKAIGNADGCGVPTIKPWNIDTIKEKMAQAKASGCFAVAMDVDAAGLPFLKNMTPPAGWCVYTAYHRRNIQAGGSACYF